MTETCLENGYSLMFKTESKNVYIFHRDKGSKHLPCTFFTKLCANILFNSISSKSIYVEKNYKKYIGIL